RRSLVAAGAKRAIAHWRAGAAAEDDVGDQMTRTDVLACAACVALGATAMAAQHVRPAPRPPAQAPGPPRPEDGTAAPDGYARIPERKGQTGAPRASKIADYRVDTVAEGLSGAFCFDFLPDGRLIVGERAGRIKIVAKDGKVSEPVAGLPENLWTRNQGLFEVRPDRAFATNRSVYLPYTVLPDGSDQSALPRSPGVLLAASATLSADASRLENVKVLLNAEGTGGRLVQARDGTLFITSTVPAGVGINSVDWPQPQQPDSNMGEELRLNPAGSIPQDNPVVARARAHPPSSPP